MADEIQENNDSILDSFVKTQNKNELLEVLKELFDPKKVELITDISADEIKLITRIHMISELKKIPSYQQAIIYFMKLSLSKDRKSRREIIDAVKGYSQQMGLLKRMNPFNKGG